VDNNELANMEMELRKLGRGLIDNKIECILLDFATEIRKDYPDYKADAAAYARKIVAYCREHLSK
jgi:hypothetical protein